MKPFTLPGGGGGGSYRRFRGTLDPGRGRMGICRCHEQWQMVSSFHVLESTSTFWGGLSKYGIHDGPFLAERSIERYCPKEDSWEVVGELPTARSGFGVTVVGHCIYLIGGALHEEGERHHDAEATDLVEIYDTKSGAWSIGVPLLKPIQYVYSCASYLRFDQQVVNKLKCTRRVLQKSLYSCKQS